MCGIAGTYFFDKSIQLSFKTKEDVLSALKHRGPDFQNSYSFNHCTLFHARLSILDLSEASNQPFLHPNQNSGIVYNGEIFNYKDLSHSVEPLQTHGDVEVLFKLFEKTKIELLNTLNGFFAFAYYNQHQDEMYIVRDRYGLKPMYYYQDDKKLCFASEIKTLLQLCGPQSLNHIALNTYFRLNYISGKETIFKNIYRLLPGEFIEIKNNKAEIKNWYKLPTSQNDQNLQELLSDAVKIRLNADVPVGSFLSGGIDSSIISALAKQHHQNIHTFSIGFADEPFFDETYYAEKVARHINSNHHAFKLKNSDFLNHVHPFLNSIDEPFADSSALNVYILSKYTKSQVKVALSGDGADELYMGYNKHKAEYLSNKMLYKNIIPAFSPIYNLMVGSRNSGFGNKIRQLKRFSEAVKLSPKERYMSWACISSQSETDNLFTIKSENNFDSIFEESFSQTQFNPVNYADLKIVLADDMLVKADRMSMQHGLEIRNPFLDFRVVEMAMNLPTHQKINGDYQKVILRNSFKHLLPADIFTRSKKGFELPLWKWLKKELKSEIESKWLSEDFIKQQNIFNFQPIHDLKQKLYSNNPGDAPAKIWALIVFQQWYLNNSNFIKNNN